MTEINIFRHSPDARDIPAGEVLFDQGDSGDAMFVSGAGPRARESLGCSLGCVGDPCGFRYAWPDAAALLHVG